MKRKLVISAAVALICLAASAQAEKIEKLNSNLTTVEGHFTMTKTLAANGKKMSGEGTIYFEAPDKMALIYSTPKTDYLKINGNHLYLAKGNKKNSYDTSKNATIRNLSNTLLNCTMGKIQTVADDNDAEVSVKESGSSYDVIIKARRKAAKGYSEIALSYRKSDGILCSMRLTEFNGNVTDYSFSGFKKGDRIPAMAFFIDAERKSAAEKPLMYEIQ